MRTASIERSTKETKISLRLNLDGSGASRVDTGIAFFDHMLDLLARHSLIDLEVKAVGDLSVDYHHTVEDVGIVLGQAIREALGAKAGINRYGSFLLPMDETLAQCVLDLGGRALLVYKADVPHPYVRDFNIYLAREFFQALANNAAANVHLELKYGEEPHHVCEALFKAFARALDIAKQVNPRMNGQLPSTKGAL